MNQTKPEFEQHGTDDEIDLVELFLILWKRKWMIIIVTLLMTVAAAGVSMVMPKVYNITAILEPGKDADGQLVESAQTIRENIVGGTYDQIISSSLTLSLDDIPEFKVNIPTGTSLIFISFGTTEPKRGLMILDKLLQEISADLRNRLAVKIAQTRNQIKAVELQGQALDDQIKLLVKQLPQIENKIVDLEDGRRQALASSARDAMALLLYSNEIQNQQIYLNNLQTGLAGLQNEKRQNIIDIENAKLRLDAIKSTNINKYPSEPEKPIKPKKTSIVALAFLLGFIGSIMLAFIAEFMKKVRMQQAETENNG